MRNLLAATGFFLTVFVVFANSCRSSEPATPAQLHALAPVISTEDAKITSLLVQGFTNDEARCNWKYSVVYKSNGRFSELISDAIDGTPLLYAAENKALLYNCVDNVLLICEHASVSFSLFVKGGRCYNSILPIIDERINNNIVIDIKSMFSHDIIGETLVKSDGEVSLLTSTTRSGNVLRTWFNAKRHDPLVRLTFCVRNNERPLLGLDTLAVNGRIEDGKLAFPTRKAMARSFSLIAWTEDAAEAALDAYVAVRGYPGEREMFERSTGRAGLDWKKVEEQYRRAAEPLRRLTAGFH